jgi:KDEL-tailed cysteine endopeptidase
MKGVAVALIDASSSAFQHYKSGILNGGTSSCGTPTSGNTWVALIGYYNSGAMGNTPFWTIQNSWGVSWGLSGYAQIAMTPGNAGACGINL